jgi:DNA-directed RNA polymerase subunit RPC12/RpoP
MLIMSYKECNQVFRCKDCGMIICESNSKSGNSTLLIGILTLGLSEIVRAIYHKITRHCPNCNSKNLIKSK